MFANISFFLKILHPQNYAVLVIRLDAHGHN